MSKLSMLTQMSEVKSVVVGDQEGMLSDSRNEPDAESIAAVMGFLCNAINSSGEVLGFGAVQKMSISSSKKASILYVNENNVLTIGVDASKPIAAIEKKIEQALQI